MQNTAGKPFPRFLYFSLLAAAYGVYSAANLRWTCDDAFISFQYARNFVRGNGLVFNPGERVEGYTNFLWTLWVALGMKAGAAPEIWANAGSIACYGASIALLALLAFRLNAGRTALVLPIAALGAALHQDYAVFATSGLETAPFTFLALAGYAALVWHGWPTLRAALLAAVLFALCSLTRPDGVLFAFCGGLFVVWQAGRNWRLPVAYAAAFCLIWVPFMLWRVGYYGDIFPNTYYAKSAYLTWYDQGVIYLALYLKRYWSLAVIPLLALAYLIMARRGSTGPAHKGAPENENWITPPVWLAALFAATYTFYIVRVGGDFMYARLLIPTVPFMLIVVEGILNRLAVTGKRRMYAAFSGALLIILLISPSPLEHVQTIDGVTDERLFYSPEVIESTENTARVLYPYFKGLPVNVAFMGMYARVVYRLDVPLAVESATGLTDRTVARQVLTERGRPGHEKTAKLSYLVERKVSFLLGRDYIIANNPAFAGRYMKFDDVLLPIIYRDEPLLNQLKERGAVEVRVVR